MTIWLHKWWAYQAELGLSSNNSSQKNDKIRLVNHAYLFCGFGFFISFALRLAAGLGVDTLILPAVSTIVFALLPILSYKGHPVIGWHIGITFILLAITYSSLIKPACFANYTLYGVILFLNIYLFSNNKKIQFFYLAFIAVNLLAFTHFSNQNPALNHGFPITLSVIIVLIAMTANYFIIVISMKNRMLREKELTYAISLKDAALNATKDAAIIIDLKQNITGFNQQYLDLWGVSEEEIKIGGLNELIKKGLPKIVNLEAIKKTNSFIRQNPNAPSFLVIYFKDGRIIESHTQPQLLDNVVVGRVYNYRDVTKQYQAAKKMRESEARFRNLFEYSPLGILILEDEDEPFKNVNGRFCEMLGYSQEELFQKKVKDITSPEHFDIQSKYYKDLQDGLIDSFKIKKKYLKKSGETFWGNINISAIRDKNGAIISEIIMIEDINEQKEQEERIKNLVIELKLLNEELEKQVKTQTIDLRHSNRELIRSNKDLEQFAYIASHDLQEPLRMIGNFVQLLERQYEEKFDVEGKEYMYYIVDGVNRMSKLIQNLLKYSRVGRMESELRKIDLGKIVEAKLFGLSRKIEETKAEIKISEMPLPIYCEPNQIGMVFFNLLTNALKFNGGIPKIIIGCEDKENHLLFFVKDNGIGIDKRYETKVFEIFKRLHRREDYQGTGIGLALCKKIIARHGGDIWFESQPDSGTIFYFTISKNLQHEKFVPIDSNLVS